MRQAIVPRVEFGRPGQIFMNLQQFSRSPIQLWFHFSMTAYYVDDCSHQTNQRLSLSPINSNFLTPENADNAVLHTFSCSFLALSPTAIALWFRLM